MRDFKDFYLSYSSLSSFLREDTCSKKQVEQKVLKSFTIPPTEAMTKGLIFESLAIGSDASGESHKPKKGVEYERMAEQADEAKKQLNESFENIHTQVLLTNEELRMKAIVDVVGINSQGALFFIDLKYTGSVASTWGDYSWGDHENRDYSQFVFQKILLEHTGTVVHAPEIRQLSEGVYYLEVMVFDGSKDYGKKHIKLDITNEAIDEMNSKINSFWSAFEQWEAGTEPSLNPTRDNCKDCGVKDCPARIDLNKIETFKVTV